ncbi:MAG TPA: FkbM family methyltransferase, partial [Bacteroidales bacterium]|nr:FkbM family methyltransferase [Bacteroidales bacterium]
MKSLKDNSRYFFRYILKSCPVRTGKIPVLNLLTRLGIARNFTAVITFDENIRVQVDLDDWIQKQIFFFGSYLLEQQETRYWCKSVKQGEIILDIGANIGYYSLLASKRIGGRGRIYAFEAAPETFKKLSANIQRNEIENVVAYNLAIADFRGTIDLHIADTRNSGMSSIAAFAEESGQTVTVPTDTIDNFVNDNSVDRIDRVKIDVEGAEMLVLKGMENTLRKFKPVIHIELIDSRLRDAGSSLAELWAFLLDLGYRA